MILYARLVYRLKLPPRSTSIVTFIIQVLQSSRLVRADHGIELDRARLIRSADEVVELVRVTADLRRIPTHNFPTTFGKDGLLYYDLKFEIEITYYSAYTKYELIYDGKNYGPVSAEYV